MSVEFGTRLLVLVAERWKNGGRNAQGLLAAASAKGGSAGKTDLETIEPVSLLEAPESVARMWGLGVVLIAGDVRRQEVSAWFMERRRRRMSLCKRFFTLRHTLGNPDGTLPFRKASVERIDAWVMDMECQIAQVGLNGKII